MNLGYDESGSGPVLVLIHGFPVNRTIWTEQLNGLSHLRRVVAPDLRGRGKSPVASEEGWSIQDHADDIADTVASLGAGPVDLAGLSMGGYIAFALMRSHPELVRSLILVSTRAVQDPPEYKTGRRMTAERAERFGTRALAESMIDKLLTPGAPEALRQQVLAMFDAVPGATSAKDSLAMRDRADSTPLLAAIPVPTLVIEGAEEDLLPAGSATAIAEAIPGARLASIPGGGHFVPIENPAGFNLAVEDFLGSATRG